MESPDLTIPLRQAVNIVTLTQAVIFAALLAARHPRGAPAAWFLILALIALAATKADQLYQLLGGLRYFPAYGFVLTPIQALITPALYLYVRCKTEPDPVFTRGALWHLTPFFLLLAYCFITYYSLSVDEKKAMLDANAFSSPLNRLIVPLIGDFIQLGYVAAALHRLSRFGVSLKSWFSQVENRDQRWLKRLMVLWGAVFVFHTLWTIFAGAVGSPALARGVLDLLNWIHLAMVNALFVMGVSAPSNREQFPPLAKSAAAKYENSTMSQKEREALFGQTMAAMRSSQPYLTPDLTLRDLADQLAATPRELSEAINGVGNQSFFDFINTARVEHAKRLLVDEPGWRILDIAYKSGFNSKTAFNESFRKKTGQAPRDFRRANTASRSAERRAEKTA